MPEMIPARLSAYSVSEMAPLVRRASSSCRRCDGGAADGGDTGCRPLHQPSTELCGFPVLPAHAGIICGV